MLRSNTHFEQIPIEAVKALVPQAIHEDESTERLEQTKEKNSKNSLETED